MFKYIISSCPFHFHSIVFTANIRPFEKHAFNKLTHIQMKLYLYLTYLKIYVNSKYVKTDDVTVD